MTGGAGAGAAAIGIDAGNVVLDRAFHDALAAADLDGVLGSVVFDIDDLGHLRKVKIIG